MSNTLWLKDNKLIVDQNNKLILCSQCPCQTAECSHINKNMSAYI